MKLYKADLKDKKILYELIQNARFSYSTIAKNVGLSQEMVYYRIKRMKNANVIKKFTINVFRTLLGMYLHIDIYLSLYNKTNNERKRIIELIEKIPEVMRIFETEGRFNLLVSFGVYNKIHLSKVYDKIQEICGDLKDYEICFLSRDKNLKQTFFLEEGRYTSPKRNYWDAYNSKLTYCYKNVPSGLVKIDKTDFKILKMLRENSRMSLKDMGKKLNLSSVSINKRIIKMIEKKVLVFFITEIEPNRLGYKKYIVLLKLKNNDKNRVKLVSFLDNLNYSRYKMNYVGKWDCMYFIHVKNEEEIGNIISQAYETFPDSIKGYDILWVRNIVKYISFPDNIEEIYKKAKTREN